MVRSEQGTYYLKNRDKMLAKRRASYRTNAKRDQAAHRKWRAANPGKVRRMQVQWRKTVDGYLRTKLHRLKVRTAGITECTLTFEQLRRMYNKQQGWCVLTGRSLYINGGKHSLDALSIDRKNQRKGYTIRNVRLVTWQANSARNSGTDAQLVDFCRDVLKYARRSK